MLVFLGRRGAMHVPRTSSDRLLGAFPWSWDVRPGSADDRGSRHSSQMPAVMDQPAWCRSCTRWWARPVRAARLGQLGLGGWVRRILCIDDDVDMLQFMHDVFR